MGRKYADKDLERLARTGPPTTYAEEADDAGVEPFFVSEAPIKLYDYGYVYHFYNYYDLLLYVGKTLNPRGRMLMHAKNPQWYRQIDRVEWFGYPGTSLRDEESRHIREYGPIYNVVRPKEKK